MGADLEAKLKFDRVMNSVAAGTTAQNGSILDMAGYEGVIYIALFGALTATQVTSIKAQQGAAANMSDAADLAGTLVGPLADTDGNKCLMVAVKNQQERYSRCVVNRATANAVIDGVLAIRYGAGAFPIAQAAAAGIAFSESFVAPAEGTA